MDPAGTQHAVLGQSQAGHVLELHCFAVHTENCHKTAVMSQHSIPNVDKEVCKHASVELRYPACT